MLPSQIETINNILKRYQSKGVMDLKEEGKNAVNAHSREAYRVLLGMTEADVQDLEKIDGVKLRSNPKFAHGLEKASFENRRALFYANLETVPELLREIEETGGLLKLWGTFASLKGEVEEIFCWIMEPEKYDEAVKEFERRREAGTLGRKTYDKWEGRLGVVGQASTEAKDEKPEAPAPAPATTPAVSAS